MSYVKSLRFKLMLLSVIPLVSLAVLFITHSVIIALQMRDMSGSAYVAATTAAGADASIIQAVRGVSVDTDWIARQWLLVFLLAFVCFYIPITINIRKIIMPIREVSKYSDSLAEGNVQIEVVKNRTDEIGILQESLQRLVRTSRQQADLIQQMAAGDISGSYLPRSASDIVGHSLVRMLESNNVAMKQVTEAAGQSALLSSQIAESSQLLAERSTQQATAVSELSDSIQNVTRLTNENTKMVNRAAALGDTIIDKAQNGGHQMNRMVEVVKEINEASADINKVMKVINDIAFQTNILALNAAVEAAAAGPQGKGFAIVADEVRKLSFESAEAAKDISKLIVNSIEVAQLGTKIANETAASLAEIVAEIDENSRITSSISQCCNQQDNIIKQINTSMAQVSEVIYQNSASAEELAASSEEMSAQSIILQELVTQFKLRKS